MTMMTTTLWSQRPVKVEFAVISESFNLKNILILLQWLCESTLSGGFNFEYDYYFFFLSKFKRSFRYNNM